MTDSMRAKWINAILAVALVLLSGCATTQVARHSHDLREQIAEVDRAYRNLEPNSTEAYNASLAPIAREMEGESSAQFQ
jgi:hypothetical protein